ncbi:hypothetical protein P3T18_004589 [Paraburkholderia sp. GAS199]|uniref:hypothetical protein n=1 Tax=Paraburkholderia sp. GAS199 TaxID=3035126 RepID=UPI003D219FC0
MNKPSERIVVFVTTAQKRAIAATAESLGISVSELMRRAVLSFGATSEQVKAASIVDRLRAPRAPDALNAALQKVARGTRHARAALPPELQTKSGTAAQGAVGKAAEKAAQANATASGGLPTTAAGAAPLLPAGVLAALSAAVDEEASAATEAVARVAAAKAAAVAQAPQEASSASPSTSPAASLGGVFKRPRIDKARDEDDDPRSDPSTEGGRFA